MLALVGTLYVFVGTAAFGGIGVVLVAMATSLWAGRLCCSVLQYVAVCCFVLQGVAVCR